MKSGGAGTAKGAMVARVAWVTTGALVAMGAFTVSAVAAQPGDAQPYPVRPIRIIVPNTAGSAMDTVTRMIGQRMTVLWGQQIVVDDRPGASGIIGHELAAKAPADGYTLLFAASAGVTIQPLINKVPYDSERDFAPLSLVVTSVQVLASHPSVAAHTVDELLAVVRARPGQLNCGTPGSGTSNHLACEMLNVLGEVKMLHVPFKGTGPALTGLMSGQVHIGFASISTIMPQIRSGELRALGQGGATRSPVISTNPSPTARK